jgi:hypothetical protein
MNIENEIKAWKPKNNKVLEPDSNKADVLPEVKMVWIRINHNRAIAGIGVAGDEVEVSQLVANNFVAQGLATIIKKEK